ncbi:38999_t:CDS:2, partial [Gigaspora margarita]
MSVSVNSDPAVFSRLQLAKALKEDPENSAIFIHNRSNDDNDSINDNIIQQSPLQSPQLQRKRASSYSSLNDSPRDSIIMSEERRGSLGKQATLMDVRQSILNNRHNNIVSSFSPTSSQRTSLILQQPKSPLPDVHTAKTPSKSNSLPNPRPSPSSVQNNAPLRSSNNSSRPPSFYANVQSRPNSIATNQSRPSSSYTNSPSRPSSLVNQFTHLDPNDSDSDQSPKLTSKNNQLSITKKIQKNKLDNNKIKDKLKKVKEETFNASPLGRGSNDHRRHRSNTFDSHPQKSLSHQNFRRKSHSELPQQRKNDLLSSPQLMIGRISPSHRQEPGSWASETLAALSVDVRHQMLMGDSSSTTTSTSGSANIMPRERKDSAASLNKPRERKDSAASLNKPRERKDSAASLNKPRERKDSATNLNKSRERKDSPSNLNISRHNRNHSNSSYGSLHSPHSPYSPKLSTGYFPPQPYSKSKHRDSLHPHSSINMNYGHIPISEGGRNSHGHYTNYTSESNRKVSSSDRSNPSLLGLTTATTILGVTWSQSYRDKFKLIVAGIFRSTVTLCVWYEVRIEILHYRFKNYDSKSAEYKASQKFVHLRVAKRLLRLCRLHTGIYVKGAQHLASLTFIVPKEYIETLSVLQDRAPYRGIEDVKKIFAEEFNGLTPNDVYSEFDETPIAAASLAQVHK